MSFFRLFLITLCVIILSVGCSENNSTSPVSRSVPHEERWGIYALDIVTGDVELLVSSPQAFSRLELNRAGDKLIFYQKINGSSDDSSEICTINIDGNGFERLTHNNFYDLCPTWSPADTQIAFLSWHNDLDLYIMDADGSNIHELYDSGSHDSDPHWGNDKIAFTAFSKIWSIKADGTEPTQITDPPRAGEWGNANLPFGDYDPRWNPDGTLIVFERLEADSSVHGNYNIFVTNPNGTGETRLTDTGYSQGFASWSHAGDRIVFIVAAIGTEGKYDIHMMNADGTDNQNITPDYFPAEFLCHTPVFSSDDSKIFFAGEWWE